MASSGKVTRAEASEIGISSHTCLRTVRVTTVPLSSFSCTCSSARRGRKRATAGGGWTWRPPQSFRTSVSSWASLSPVRDTMVPPSTNHETAVQQKMKTIASRRAGVMRFLLSVKVHP